jgi:monoamine oxidase
VCTDLLEAALGTVSLDARLRTIVPMCARIAAHRNFGTRVALRQARSIARSRALHRQRHGTRCDGEHMSDANDDRNSGQPAPFQATRRKFLADVGKAGGAAVMYNVMEAMGLFRGVADAQAADTFVPLEPGGPTASVLILGGGIAGLTSAYELLKGGHQVTILEPRLRPGGRNWTARGGTQEAEIDGPLQVCSFAKGEYMNMGPARLPQGHITIDYCRDLGVELQVFTNANADGYYFNENTATTNYGPAASTPTRHRMAKADYYGYVSELLAKCVNQGALDAELTADDKSLLITFLRSFGALTGPTTASVYTGTTRRGYEVTPGAGSQTGTPFGPPPPIADVLRSRFGQNFAFEFGWDQAMLMFQPVGGMDRIAYAFERAIQRMGGRIVYGAEVTEIANTATGVDVTVTKLQAGRSFELSADYCICTIPPMVLKNLVTNFTPEVKSALAVPTPVSTGKVGLEYQRRFWETDERILGGITNTNLNNGTIWYPSYGFLGNRGVVVGSYNFGSNADLYASFSPEARIDEAVTQGMKVHGAPYRDELASGYTVAWRRVKYSEGGWVGWPGGRGAAYDLLNLPDGNVYFAGDHLSYEIAWQAGAIYSARKAVGDLAARIALLARRRTAERIAQIA